MEPNGSELVLVLSPGELEGDAQRPQRGGWAASLHRAAQSPAEPFQPLFCLGVINAPRCNQHDSREKQTLNLSTDFKSLSTHRNSLALNLPARHGQPQGIWTLKQRLHITELSARGQEQERVYHSCFKFNSSFC